MDTRRQIKSGIRLGLAGSALILIGALIMWGVWTVLGGVEKGVKNTTTSYRVLLEETAKEGSR